MSFGQGVGVAEAIVGNRNMGLSGQQTVLSGISPTAYHPFSKKLVVSLTAFGGVLVIFGGLGTWIRVAQQETSRSPIEDVDAVMGYADPIGLVLASLGAIAVATAFLWGMQRLMLKVAPVVVALAVAGIAFWRIPMLDRRADDILESGLRSLASMDSPFYSMHAGRGWGAWMLIAGAVVLLLGAVAGIMREIDLHKEARLTEISRGEPVA